MAKYWIAGMALLASMSAAVAQTAPSPAHTNKPHRSKQAVAGPPAASATKQTWSALIHGSPEQRALEREDNERAGIRAIDHSNDDLGTDWRGFK